MTKSEVLKCEIKEELDELKNMRHRVSAKETKLQALATEYAVETSPFRIGQRVIRINDKQHFEVTRIVGDYNNIERPDCFGRKIKKDGGLHKLETRFWWFNGVVTDHFKPVDDENI